MENFKTYISEAKNRGLTIFDIDDTMFKTKARVKINPSGKVLTPKQFNTYKLGKGESFDFGEFKSAEIFKKTAVPIGKMIAKFKAILKNAVGVTLDNKIFRLADKTLPRRHVQDRKCHTFKNSEYRDEGKYCGLNM